MAKAGQVEESGGRGSTSIGISHSRAPPREALAMVAGTPLGETRQGCGLDHHILLGLDPKRAVHRAGRGIRPPRGRHRSLRPARDFPIIITIYELKQGRGSPLGCVRVALARSQLGRPFLTGKYCASSPLTISENPEPERMRVFRVQGAQETLDEAEEARAGRDHPQGA